LIGRQRGDSLVAIRKASWAAMLEGHPETRPMHAGDAIAECLAVRQYRGNMPPRPVGRVECASVRDSVPLATAPDKADQNRQARRR
jgi:hypothetical protein